MHETISVESNIPSNTAIFVKNIQIKQSYYYTRANDAQFCVVKTNKRFEDGFQKQKKSDKC